MKIVSAVQQKGGVGKTNIIYHLAHSLHQKGFKVAVVDNDHQGNITGSIPTKANINTVDFYNKNLNFTNLNLPEFAVFSGTGKLADIEQSKLDTVGEQFRLNIMKLSDYYDVCLIDTAPQLGVKMTSALYVSNYTFTPMEMATYSLDGLQKMTATIRNMQKINKSLDFIGVVVSRLDKRDPRQVKKLNDLKNNLPDLIVPAVIGQRTTNNEATDLQIPIWKVKKTSARAAAKELDTFAEFMIKRMEL